MEDLKSLSCDEYFGQAQGWDSEQLPYTLMEHSSFDFRNTQSLNADEIVSPRCTIIEYFTVPHNEIDLHVGEPSIILTLKVFMLCNLICLLTFAHNKVHENTLKLFPYKHILMRYKMMASLSFLMLDLSNMRKVDNS